MGNKRHEVLGQIVEAVSIVSACEKVCRLIPEVRSNIVMCTENPKGADDVAGIPGRLTVVHGKVTAAAYPDWAASVFTSQVLITMNSIDPSLRAVMEIRYSGELISALSNKGYTLYEIPDSHSWESTMREGLSKENSAYPIFYSKGDWAREGAVIVGGRDAVSVAREVVEIAQLL